MTDRLRPANRRPNESRAIDWVDPLGGGFGRITVTVGFGADGRPIEVFARAARPGSTMDAMLDEGCVLLSRDIQHGRSLESLKDLFQRSGDGRPFTPLGAAFDVLCDVALDAARP